MSRVLAFCLRIGMFFLMGVMVMAMDQALGVPSSELPWIFVGAGLGGAVAVDVWLRWMARRHARQAATRAAEDDRTPHRHQ